MTEYEAEQLYNEFLDTQNITDFVSNPTSDMLKELDPTMYDCGFADFCDGENIELE